MTDFATARYNMVESQIRVNNVTDPAILSAMGELPRERFLPEELRSYAYVDEDLRVRNGRYLMEPSVLARLLQAAEVGREDVALDVGCATGYSSAVLARLANTVVALEEDPELAAAAAANLSELGVDNVAVVKGPLKRGCPEQAPFHVILLGGGVTVIPAALLDQLAEAGRLVAVVFGEGGVGKGTRVVRRGGAFTRQILFDAAVPTLPGFDSVGEFVF